MSSVDPQAYVRISQHLLSTPVSDCSDCSRYNSSVNRAYYGAFLSTRQVLERDHQKDFDERSTSSHQDVLNELLALDAWWADDIHDLLKGMKKKRELADYSLANPFTFEAAENVIFDARRIISLTKSPRHR